MLSLSFRLNPFLFLQKNPFEVNHNTQSESNRFISHLSFTYIIGAHTDGTSTPWNRASCDQKKKMEGGAALEFLTIKFLTKKS